MSGGLNTGTDYAGQTATRSKLKIIISLAAAVTLLAALVFSRVPASVRGYSYEAFREAAKINIMLRTWGWDSLEGEIFLVRHRPGDKAGANLVLEAAEKFYPQVAGEFDYQGKSKIPIIVYPSKEELNASFGWPASESAMGVYWGGVIRVLSPEVWISPGDPEEMTGIFMESGPIAHELTHLVVDYLARGNYTRWFTEGLAQYQEYKLTGFLFDDPVGSLEQELYPLGELDRGFDALPNQSLAYRQSLSAVEYIVEFYGEDRLHKIISTLGRGQSMNQALMQVLGTDLEQFENQWHLWLGETEEKLVS